MSELRNVSKEDGFPILLEGLVGGDPSRAIEAQEARGQSSFVHSDTLPIEGTKPRRGFLYNGENSRFETMEEWLAHDDEPIWADLGFVLGEAVPADECFRYATLPEGWSKKGSDHSMWSYIVDERGRERAGVFYKAAFYDRRAHISLTKLEGPNGKAYEDHPFLLDKESLKFAPEGSAPWCATCNRNERHRWHQPEAAVPTGDERAP